MKIGILGSDGFLGTALCKQFPEAVQITKKNYFDYVGDSFDVFINANGNSRKYWAEQNPYLDFMASTASVYQTFRDFKIEKYIYISSVDAQGDTVYGFHKKLAEQIVEKNANSYLILRCCAMIGEGMKKGVVYDLINEKPLWVTEDTGMRFITVNEVAKCIDILIKNDITDIMQISGLGNIAISEIATILEVKYTVRNNAMSVYQIINDADSLNLYFPVKTSKQYLEEFTNERMVNSTEPVQLNESSAVAGTSSGNS